MGLLSSKDEAAPQKLVGIRPRGTVPEPRAQSPLSVESCESNSLVTLVRAWHWSPVLVLSHVRGHGEWPLSATKAFRMITLERGDTPRSLVICKLLHTKSHSRPRFSREARVEGTIDSRQWRETVLTALPPALVSTCHFPGRQNSPTWQSNNMFGLR